MDIAAITAYMSEHLGDDASLETVAQQFHYAPAYFSRQFKKMTGVTYRKYLESMRIQAGMRKFLTETGNVTDVAGQVGYDYSSNFSKIFKRQTGCQAKAYKRTASRAYSLLQDFIKAKGSLVYRRFEGQTSANQLTVSLRYPQGAVPDLVFVGLFPDPLPNQPPVVGLATTDPQSVLLDQIPSGAYYLLACDISAGSSFFTTFVMLDNYRARRDEVLVFGGQSQYELVLPMEEAQPHHPLITVNLPKMVMDSLLKKSR